MATKSAPKTNPKAAGNANSAAADKANSKTKPSGVSGKSAPKTTPTTEDKTKTKRTPKSKAAMELSDIKLPDFPDVEDFAGYSDEQLKNFVDNYNKITEDGDRTTAPISLDANADRDVVVQAIIEAMGIDNTKVDQCYATALQHVVKIPISKIFVHPDNPREPVDYIDPSLLNSIKKSGGMIGTPVVVSSENAGLGDEDKFYVIHGNRSYINYFKYVTEDLGENPDEHFVEVALREYAGSIKEIKSQIFYELAAANDKAQNLTVINRLELVNKRLADGAKKTSIAEEMGISSSMVSQIVSLNLLPRRILELVHYEGTKDRLVKLSQKQLTEYGVPFTVKGDVVKIEGITFKNAQALVAVIPKKPARSNFKTDKLFNESFDAWTKVKDNIVDYFLDEKIINMAVSESEATFARKLTDFLKEVHILPGGKNIPPADVAPPKNGQTDIEDKINESKPPRESSGEPPSVDQKIKPDENSTKPPESKTSTPEELEKTRLVRALYKDSTAFAETIDDGSVDMAAGWQEVLIAGLKANDMKILELCKLMINNGIIAVIDED